MHKSIILGSFFLFSITGTIFGPWRSDVLSLFGDVRAIQASSYFDGNDWEVTAWDYRHNFRTDNSVDDRNTSFGGTVAVWQRLTEQGWEIMAYSLVAEEERQLTQNGVDDIMPVTDGNTVAWQTQDAQGVWRIMRMDVFHEEAQPEQISLFGTATDPQMQDGVVVWQEWIEGDWEIMSYSAQTGTMRVTYNQEPDIAPHLLQGDVVWEGEDREGKDREIFRFDLLQGTTEQVTQNELDDQGLDVKGEELKWFERREGTAAEVLLNLASGQIELTRLLPVPSSLPRPIEESPAPVPAPETTIQLEQQQASEPELVPEPIFEPTE